jgi:hypothetical protein
MTFADRLWLRLPVVARAVLIGVAAAAAGTLPWAALVSANTRHLSGLPWAVPVMAMYGPDVAFWGNVAALLIVATLTVWAYSTLARAMRKARASSAA